MIGANVDAGGSCWRKVLEEGAGGRCWKVMEGGRGCTSWSWNKLPLPILVPLFGDSWQHDIKLSSKLSLIGSQFSFTTLLLLSSFIKRAFFSRKSRVVGCWISRNYFTDHKFAICILDAQLAGQTGSKIIGPFLGSNFNLNIKLIHVF